VPEQEGKGIGSALLTELIRESRRRHAEDLLLEVRADNPRAQQLYRRFGFEQIHVRPRYYRDGVNALIMRLELRTAGAGTADAATAGADTAAADAAGKMTGQDSDQPREADRP
jgi:ribosomal-protein-alanine N-acetyltransferase